MAFFACSDPCEDVSCQNGGACDDGTCICEDGYSGTNCETENRAGLIGTWIGFTDCPDEPAASATFIISEGSTITDITVEADGDVLDAVVTGPGTFSLTPVTIEVLGFVVTTSGTGVLQSNGEIQITIDSELDGVPAGSCVFSGAQ